MIIDVEHHISFRELMGDRVSRSDRIERFRDSNGRLGLRSFPYSTGQHLEFMDEVGIDVTILTGDYRGGLEEMARWNDACARVVNQHPKRFVAFASIPPLAGQPALNEMERAVKELGMKGVHILARADAFCLDSSELWPFYEKVCELGIPVDVHIKPDPQGFDALHADYPLHYILAREFDVCAATFRLCLGGVLERFPDLVFIINHFGGGIASVIERIDAYMRYSELPGWTDFYPGKPLISKPWREYFNKLYFNMAGREFGTGTLTSALTAISPTKLLFGTDWPFNFERDPEGARRYVEEIRKLPLPQQDIDAMLGENAAKLAGIQLTS